MVSAIERITQAELARRVGVSRAAVSQATKRGILTAGRDRLYDLTRADNAAYLDRTKRQRRQGRRQSGRKPAGSPQQTPEPSGSRLKARRRQRASTGDGGGPGETWDEADRRKKIGDANKIELAVARERNDLVPRADVESVFNKLIAVLTQQTLAIPQRCSPDLCAHLGVDDHGKVIAAEKYLDVEIRRGVEQQKLLMLDFLKELERDETE